MIESVRPWLGYASGLCVLLAALWLFRWRDRGPGALFMVVASLALAGLFEGQRSDWPVPGRASLLVAFGVGVFGDFVSRIKRVEDARR